VGVYSARPAPWRGFDSKGLQAEIDSWPAPAVAPGEGAGVVDTYTIDYSGPAPVGTVVGWLDAGGERFVAMTDPADPALARRMVETDPLGAAVAMSVNDEGRSIVTAFAPAARS
jgi:acetyl-CoA C-acetyltransferase